MSRGRPTILFCAVLTVASALSACSAHPPARGRADRRGSSETAASMPFVTPTTSAAGEWFTPRPGEPIPPTAASVADALERVTRAVRRSVDEWTGAGGASTWPPPESLVLRTLYQERIYRALASRRSFARRVVQRLPGSIRVEASSIVRANASVFAVATPVRPSFAIRTRSPEPAAVLRRWFGAAERRFGVPWDILAAVNYVETKFGRVVSNSSAGAQGPMQFLPSTWATYGLGGDIRDPHDAILGAANYLHANGAPGNIRGALYHYNPVAEYVDAVTAYARVMRRDPRMYYALYCYQVYILTTHGDRRITGPGV